MVLEIYYLNFGPKCQIKVLNNSNFQKLKLQGMLNKKKLIEKRLMILQNINDFFLYNLNQNTLLSNLEENYFDD